MTPLSRDTDTDGDGDEQSMSPLSQKIDTQSGKNDKSSINQGIGNLRLNKLDQISEVPHKPDELADPYFFHHKHNNNQSLIKQNKHLELMSPKDLNEQQLGLKSLPRPGARIFIQ